MELSTRLTTFVSADTCADQVFGANRKGFDFGS